jgi:hypothetical protein
MNWINDYSTRYTKKEESSIMGKAEGGFIGVGR